MKVTVSVSGRFHAFYLARQLVQRDNLRQLITTYPKFEVAKYGIPSSCVQSLLTQEIAARVWNRLPLKERINAQFWFHENFDRSAARRISEPGDIFVGWSSFSERCFKRAKSCGAVTIVERGSAHIEYQRDILEQEYESHGLRPQLPHPGVVEKEKREYDQVDYISIPSEFVKRTFIEKGVPENKLIKVPYGVDLVNFQELPRQDSVFRVICAGALSLRKGTHYLLRAFAELSLADAELWLVGNVSPEIVPFLTMYEKNVKHVPAVPQSELSGLYSQCSVFCLCSIEEGLAMVQPQAMACGLPLICSTNTGGEELVTDGVDGFVIPIRDVEALKERILHLYRHREECREMGQNAKAKVQRGFTWDDYGTRMISNYHQILEEKTCYPREVRPL